MVNAYIIAPKDLMIQADNTPSISPLSFSAAHIKGTNTPCGIIAVNGKIFIGSTEDLPVFVKYTDGRVDILNKPDAESVAYASFVVSGTAILVSENQPRNTSNIPHLQELNKINRIAIGILENGNIFVVYCCATIEKLKTMLCAYGVSVAMLLSSNNVYFNNPRGGIHVGTQPIITLQAAYYEEMPTPIIVIDSGYDDTDVSINSHRLLEVSIAFKIATEIKAFLKERYYGTFILIDSKDELIPTVYKLKFIPSMQADLVYICRTSINNEKFNNANFLYYSEKNESSKLVLDLYKNLSQNLAVLGITSSIPTYNYSELYETYNCPVFIKDVSNINDTKNTALFKSIVRSQAETLAQTMGLQKRITNTQITNNISNKYFRVMVGQYKFKLGANELCEQLRKQGFNAYIVRE